MKMLPCLFLIILDFIVISNGDEYGLGDLAQIFAALSGQSKCELKCPSKGLKTVEPKKNHNHKPSSNGCGVPGLELNLKKHQGFTTCCDAHDLCYDTCNSQRDQCDKTFKECLKQTCGLQGIKENLSHQALKDCHGMADIFHAGTVGLGCDFFIEAQRNACLCNGRTLSKSEVKEIQRQDEL